MKNKRKKIYVLGDVRGPYRIQNVIKFLADRPQKYGFCFDNRTCHNRPFKYIKALFAEPLKVLGSNIIYVCILNVDFEILYALIWAKLLRKKILVDYYTSIYEKVVIDEKWFKPNSILGLLAQRLDKFYYYIGTKVIFLNEKERNHYCELPNLNRKKSKELILPFCIEETFKIKKKIEDRECFNICWWGSYLPLHGLEHIIEAAKELNVNKLPIHWYFFGNDSKKGEPYMQLVEKYNISDICHFENSFTMKNGKLQEFLSENCNLALGNFGDSSKAKFLMNNKVLDACAMKCLVLTGNAEVYSLYFNGKTDVFLCDNNPKNMARKIKEIYFTDAKELKKRVNNAYDIYKDNFSEGLFYKRFENIVDEL